MRPQVREVLISAGEASGDMHGAALVEQLKARQPDIAVAGIGGPRMREAGVSILAESTGVAGFVEVLRHLPAHWRLLRQLRARMATGRVGLAVLIDYGGFNLRVAAAAKAAGVPVLYFITPQVWASRPGRLKVMARVITKAAVILPFEADLLNRHGIDATFVGHPLLDRAKDLPSRSEARRRLGLREDGEVLALFPGSRSQEIRQHSADFIAVARELERRRPGLQVIVAVAPSIQLDSAAMPYPMVRASSFDVLRAANVALCKSGTTTLEAAIAGCPCAVVYRTSAITYAILKRIVNLTHIGLVNIVAGGEVAPEFLQHDFVPVRVADALDPLFAATSPQRAAMVEALASVRAHLGEPGAAGRVADMALAIAK